MLYIELTEMFNQGQLVFALLGFLVLSLGAIALIAYLGERKQVDEPYGEPPGRGFRASFDWDAFEDPEGPSSLTVRELLDAVGTHSEP